MTQALSAEDLEALRNFDTATVSNAIEHFEVRDRTVGYGSNELICQLPGVRPMVGYAVTVTGDTTRPGDTRPSRVVDVVDLVAGAPQPSVLVIQYVGDDRRRSCFVGDMFCLTVNRFGAVGVVTDGNARDRVGIQEKTSDFQLFSTGWVASHGYGCYLDFNVPVSICGMEIRPGDLLHGDENGLITIPHEIAPQVARQAQVVRDVEGQYFELFQNPALDRDELKRRVGPGH